MQNTVKTAAPLCQDGVATAKNAAYAKAAMENAQAAWEQMMRSRPHSRFYSKSWENKNVKVKLSKRIVVSELGKDPNLTVEEALHELLEAIRGLGWRIEFIQS